MGCDIHVQLEVRDYETRKWRLVRGPFKCNRCKGTGFRHTGTALSATKCHWCDGKKTDREVWSDRNYVVFGILANVRSSIFPAIAEPRGWPKDLSSELMDIINDEGKDDNPYLGNHSESWVTLQELEQYDLSRPGVCHGVIGLADWYAWDGVTEPKHYSGGVGGDGIRTIGEKEAKEWVAEHGPPKPNPKPFDDWFRTFDEPSRIYVAVEWVQKAETCGLDELITAVTKAARDADVNVPGDVRIVFGFDS